MDFIFVCLSTQDVFKTPNFEIIENNGVITDSNGNKMLDAKILLTEPCPVCGEKHVYNANELSCPFNL